MIFRSDNKPPNWNHDYDSSCTEPEMQADNASLLPLRVKKIVDCINIVDEQKKFLGNINFDLSCDFPYSLDSVNCNICIDSIGTYYDNIGIPDSSIKANINGDCISLIGKNNFNNLYNYFEGKNRYYSNSYCDDEQWSEKVLSISGVEAYMDNGCIKVSGTLGCNHFEAKSFYDGYLNSDRCSYIAINSAQLLENNIVIDVSENVQTIIRSSGGFNGYNLNDYYGTLCLSNACKSSKIIAIFNNEFDVTCVQPNELYNGSGSFSASVYGIYKSTLTLLSVLEDNYSIYSGRCYDKSINDFDYN